MIVRKYKAKVTSIENKLSGIYTLTFALDLGKFKYSPGQFLHLSVDDEYDGSGQWPESRCFSLQSSPKDNTAKITYAVKGAYTTLMEKSIQPNSEVWLKLPYGELFEQDHDKSKSVFIAGGTGVTPFLSLFTDESFSEYQNPKIYLGFKTEEHYLYESELNNIENKSVELNLVFENISGVLNIQDIYEKNGTEAYYFISGPPVMIKLFKNKLIANGVPENQVLTDDWE